MSRVRVNAMPRPEGTTARLHQPDTHYDGSPRHICVVEFEQLSVQFDSPEDALAWLALCADHVREALRAQGGSPEPTNEDSLKAEVLDLQARLDHYDGWFGDDCGCDENPCPLTLPAVTADPHLSKESVTAIEEMLRATYEALRKDADRNLGRTMNDGRKG